MLRRDATPLWEVANFNRDGSGGLPGEVNNDLKKTAHIVHVAVSVIHVHQYRHAGHAHDVAYARRLFGKAREINVG